MQTDKIEFSLFERLAVVAIILLVSLVAVQNLLQSLKESEERTLSTAAVEYSTVKSMYADQRLAVPPAMTRMNPAGAVSNQNAPIH